MAKGNRTRPKAAQKKTAIVETPEITSNGDSDVDMSIDDSNQIVEPFFTYKNQAIFESRLTTDLSTPFKISYGTKSDLRYVEVSQIYDPRPIYETNNLDGNNQKLIKKKALMVSRYERTLADVLNQVQYTQQQRIQGLSRLRLNLARELIKGIMVEFCHLDDILYLQHTENYIISGYDSYKLENLVNINPKVLALDDYSPAITVNFVETNRYGGSQKKIEHKLENLKKVLQTIIIGEKDVEWVNFLDSLTPKTYHDSYNHSFFMHWDDKLKFVEYMHEKLNLNGVDILEQAKLVFKTLTFLDHDWEDRFLVDAPLVKVHATKIHLEHDGVLVGGVHPSQPTATHRRAREKFEIEDRFHKRTTRGTKLLKTIRNSSKHVSQGRWVHDDSTGLAIYIYANINENDRTDVLYKDRMYLYLKVKEVFPEFWIQMVPAARNLGFSKF